MSNISILNGVSILTMFLTFLPKKFIEDVVLAETNNQLQGEKVEIGEFLRFLGLWFFMATVSGFSRREF